MSDVIEKLNPALEQDQLEVEPVRSFFKGVITSERSTQDARRNQGHRMFNDWFGPSIQDRDLEAFEKMRDSFLNAGGFKNANACTNAGLGSIASRISEFKRVIRDVPSDVAINSAKDVSKALSDLRDEKKANDEDVPEPENVAVLSESLKGVVNFLKTDAVTLSSEDQNDLAKQIGFVIDDFMNDMRTFDKTLKEVINA